MSQVCFMIFYFEMAKMFLKAVYSCHFCVFSILLDSTRLYKGYKHYYEGHQTKACHSCGNITTHVNM